MSAEVLHTPFTPLPWQQDWLENKFAKFSRNVIVAARRSGKSTLLTNTCLSCAWRVPGIYLYGSPQLQQSKDIAEPMLRKAVEGIPKVVWRESESRLILPNESEILCFATARGQSQRARGLEVTGCILDEAAHADPETIDGVIMPALASVPGSWLVLSGTVRGMDALYDYAQRGWSDDPKYTNWATTTVDVHQAGNLSDEAIAEMKAGMSPSRIRRELYNDFTVSEDATLIDLADATAAAQRQPGPYHLQRHEPKFVGCDLAMEGKDRNVFVLRQGDCMVDVEFFDEPVDLSYVAGRLMRFIKKHTKSHDDGIDMIAFDATGLGAGFGDIIQSRIHGPTEIVAVKAGRNAIDTDQFYNRRAELWSLMGDWIRKPTSRLINDEQLLRELTAPTYSFNPKQQLVLERKDQIAKRLHGRSTDLADALSYTFAAPEIQRQTHDPILAQYEARSAARQTFTDYDPLKGF